MLPVAFAPSLWAATLRTLRELTRVAVTALVLVVGLNGLAAAPAAAGDLRPSEATRPGAVSRAIPLPAAEARTAASDAKTNAGPVRPALTAPVPGVPLRHLDHDVAQPPADTVLAAAADPGRASIARRGPPRA